MRTALLDADVLAYEAATANEHPIQWDANLWTLHSELNPAILQLDNEIEDIKRNLEADHVVLALSDYNDPWRKRVMPTYKANRKEKRKPIIYAALREYMHEKYEVFQRPGLEGDDILGILLTNPKLFPGEKIIVSIDKDMKTLPGMRLELKAARDSGAWFPIVSTKDEANYWHMTQTLTGDATDGYPGCRGIGAKTAAKILDECWGSADDGKWFFMEEAWARVVKAYEKAGLDEGHALRNARVARICRHGDYDYTNKEVRLWNPPK